VSKLWLGTKKFADDLTYVYRNDNDDISLTKLVLIFGAAFVFYYTAKVMERILHLPDNFFTQAVPYAAGLLGGITTLLIAMYGWKGFIDKDRYDDPNNATTNINSVLTNQLPPIINQEPIILKEPTDSYNRNDGDV